MTTFAVRLVFDRDDAARMEVRPKHREYLTSLAAAGRLRLAGPYTDQQGALLVYEVADRAELDAVLAADPYFDRPEPVATVEEIREWILLPL